MNNRISKSIRKLIDMGRVAIFDNRQGQRIRLPKAVLALRTREGSRKGHQVRVIPEPATTREGESVRGHWPASRSKYAPHVGKKQDRKLLAKIHA